MKFECCSDSEAMLFVKKSYKDGILTLPEWRCPAEKLLVLKNEDRYIAALGLSYEEVLVENGVLIEAFEIIENNRSKGYGTIIINELLACLKRLEFSKVCLFAKDEKSEKFWKRLGFEREASNEPEIYLEKSLL